ncbi:hypothetical protein [Neisseria iguanae]|nr:hypothetical protein [Neisseria iguanae]
MGFVLLFDGNLNVLSGILLADHSRINLIIRFDKSAVPPNTKPPVIMTGSSWWGMLVRVVKDAMYDSMIILIRQA